MTDQALPSADRPGLDGPPARFLSRSQVAERIGVKPDTLNRYKLPPPDAIIGDGTAAERHGWTEHTIDTWNAGRPGRGRRRPPLE